jgi:hypothetical protein
LQQLRVAADGGNPGEGRDRDPCKTLAPSLHDPCKPSQQLNRPRYGHPRVGALTEAELAAARADLADPTKAAP